MSLSPDALAMADTLWQRLAEHQPAVAAALAMQVRALPEDWSQRVLGVARPHAALELPPAGGVPVEIEPYDAADWENCPACGEVADWLCRYHEAYATGYRSLNQPLTEASQVDPKLTVAEALRRLTDADEAAARGELTARGLGQVHVRGQRGGRRRGLPRLPAPRDRRGLLCQVQRVELRCSF